MNLPDLKQLDKVIALCRKRGVSEITIDGVAIKLGEVPYKQDRKSKATPSVDDSQSPFETDTLTENELLFWSSGAPSDEMAGSAD